MITANRDESQLKDCASIKRRPQLTILLSSFFPLALKLKKLTSVFQASVIDHKFRHHIVKVAPRGDSRVDP